MGMRWGWFDGELHGASNSARKSALLEFWSYS